MYDAQEIQVSVRDLREFIDSVDLTEDYAGEIRNEIVSRLDRINDMLVHLGYGDDNGSDDY